MMKKRAGKIFSTILSLLLGAAIGVGSIAVLGWNIFEEAGFLEFMCKYLIVFFAFILTILMDTVLHEGGHCMAGLLSGYRFVSFRVGSLTLAKYKDGLKLKRFSIPGTAGQCLMAPPPYQDGNYPYKLYLAGGVFVNAVTVVVCTGIGLAVGMDVFIGRFLLLTAAGALYLALVNGIPMEVGGIANDGKDLLQLGKSMEQRRALWNGFYFNAMQQEGERAGDLLKPEEFLTDEALAKNAHEIGTMTLVAMKTAYLIDTKQYEATRTLMDKVLDNKKILALYRREFNCEKLFLELMLEQRQEEVEKLYDKELKSYIKATSSTMLSRNRLMYAYHLLYEKDEVAAQKALERFEKQKKHYPNLGDMKTEQMLIEEIQNRKKVELS